MRRRANVGARGQRTILGNPEDIADQMLPWFEVHGVEGCLIQPPTLPEGLDEFVGLVIPVPQGRGVFRADDEGARLRAHPGLIRPENRHAAARHSA